MRLPIAGVLTMLAASACGAKGPPLPPLRPVPAAPAGMTASRIGEQVTLRVVVPQANADPSSPLSISRMEIYARTVPMGSETPLAEQLIRKEFLVGTIPVRPPDPVDETGTPIPPSPTAPPDTRPAPGQTVTWSETIPREAAQPLELTRAQKARADARRSIWLPMRPTGLLAPWFRMPLPTRYYAVVGVSERGRTGSPSSLAAVSFGPPPDAPTDLKVNHTETELVVSWLTSAENAPVIVIETTRSGEEVPGQTTGPPVTTGAFKTPVTFGTERCFVVRGVIRRAGVSTESPSVGPECLTPKDTYGPPAPTGLLPVSSPDVVRLVWEPVEAPDLAGYLVLRITGTSEVVEELTPKPITQVNFSDATTRAGQTYVYHVVAVDTAGNRGLRSTGVRVDRFIPAGK